MVLGILRVDPVFRTRVAEPDGLNQIQLELIRIRLELIRIRLELTRFQIRPSRKIWLNPDLDLGRFYSSGSGFVFFL